MKTLRTCVCYDQFEIVKIFVNSHPNLLNRSADDPDSDTIVHMALDGEQEEMLKFFFTFKILDYKKQNNNETNYLEHLCGNKMIELLEIFCKKYPKSLEITYTNSRGIIEHIISLYNFDALFKNDLTQIEQMCKILINNGANPNHKNDNGYTPIFASIQYTNEKFVKFMIDVGANINEPIVRNNEFPPLTNNDPIGFSIQLGKFEIMCVLIENGGILHMVKIGELYYYTSVLLCLKYKRHEQLEYLMNIPKICEWFKSDNLIPNYLFDYGIKNGCVDKEILKLIAPEFKIESFNFNDPACKILHNEKKISICLKEYDSISNKEIILNGLLETTRILMKLSSIIVSPI